MPWESKPVTISKKQRNELKRIATSNTSHDKEKMRALIVLLLSEGHKNKEIANRLGIHENTVCKWRGRWAGNNAESKVEDYGELTGRPRNVLVPSMLRKIEETVSSAPKNQRRWTVRSLAEHLFLNIATCQRALVELNIDLAALAKESD